MEARIITNKEGKYFKISKRVKQGDPVTTAIYLCPRRGI